MRTVLAILLNAVYLGLCKQMAIAVEKISTSPQQTESTETAKPSDEVAVQQLCGWALKSTDRLKSQSPQSQELKLLHCLSTSMTSLNFLQLSNIWIGGSYFHVAHILTMDDGSRRQNSPTLEPEKLQPVWRKIFSGM